MSTVVLLVGAAACVIHHELPNGPIPTTVLPAPDGAVDGPLVIVLPGIEDDMASLRESGIAQVIQQVRPDAQVVLAEAVYGYYLDRSLLGRLRSEIIEPARRGAPREIWMLGASLGGFGTLLYEEKYPGELDRLVLLAPFPGRPSFIDEIDDAGGVVAWEPGPEPIEISPDNAPYEVWRMIRGWHAQPERAARVWLACGKRDKFMQAAELIAAVLPPEHFVAADGGHLWKVWVPAATELLRRAEQP